MDKTGASAIPNDPVAGLTDIPLPAPLSLWPQTWASRIVIVLLIAGLIAATWWVVRRWHADRYRRAALAELDQILHSRGAAPSTADAMALLVRRTALAIFPREIIAPLTGSAWLNFLDRTYGGNEFSCGVGSVLARAPYAPQPITAGDVGPLADLVRHWIRTHHV